MTLNDKTIPADLAMKVTVCALTLFLPMVMGVKYFSHLFYGAAATQAAISQTIVMLMPAMMMGMGFLALRAQTISWWKLLLSAILMSLGTSCIAAAGVTIFLHS